MTPILAFCCVNQNESEKHENREGIVEERKNIFSLIFTLSIKCNQCRFRYFLSLFFFILNSDLLMEIGIRFSSLFHDTILDGPRFVS